MPYEKLHSAIKARLGQGRCVLALDGRACSGKSTLASKLVGLYGGEVISMDEFFLPPALRTEKRLSEPGGNIHYERFLEQVVQPLGGSGDIEYDVYSCSLGGVERTRKVASGGLLVVEGVYSLHPIFGRYADITAMLDIDPALQLERLKQRETPQKVSAYLERWIPLEERYFEHFRIKQAVDLILPV